MLMASEFNGNRTNKREFLRLAGVKRNSPAGFVAWNANGSSVALL